MKASPSAGCSTVMFVPSEVLAIKNAENAM